MQSDSKDHLERCINSVATESFRDQADRDYITARLACRYGLYPQFLWASQQAVEKYLKAILLYNRIPATEIKHDLDKALNFTRRLPFEIELSDQSKGFIKHLSKYGEYRYLEIPYYANGYLMIDLDLTVWELRRYCQVLNSLVSDNSEEEETLLKKALIDIKKSKFEQKYKFKLHSGLLEKIIEERNHPNRSALLWQNAIFSSRNRKTIRVKNHFYAQNTILSIFPNILDELKKYIYISKKLANAYREHQKTNNQNSK